MIGLRKIFGRLSGTHEAPEVSEDHGTHIGTAYWANIMAPNTPVRLQFVSRERMDDSEIRRAFVKDVIQPARLGRLVATYLLPDRATSPKLLTADEASDAQGVRLAPYFFTNDLIFMTPETKAILEEFNLGQGFFHPIALFEADDTKEIAEQVFLFIPANRKDSCHAFDEIVYKNSSHDDSTRTHFASEFFGDDAVTLNRAAKNGPDVWMEARFVGALFVSDALFAALSEAGIDHHFRFRKAPIVAD